MSERFSLCVVCTGNICRSPLGEAVLRDAFAKAGMADQVSVCSAGTGSWHLGQGVDHRAEAVMRERGLRLEGHQARLFQADHFDEVDLVLALDEGHLRDLCELAPDDAARDKIRLLRSFDPESLDDDDVEVADPYYGDRRDFEITYDQVVAAAPGVVDFVRSRVPV